MEIIKYKLSELYNDCKDGHFTLYIPTECLDNPIKHHAVIVTPGGGYGHVSKREAEPVALSFMAKGFIAGVITYTVGEGCYPYPINEINRCLDILESKKEELNISDISVIGYSAGGHLAGYLGYTNPNRIKNVLLGYPVVTMGEFTHKGSSLNLCGESEELISKLSLENIVSNNSPRTFIFTTVDDQTVNFENTLKLICALRKNKVSFEVHAFEHGVHGMSLATKYTAQSIEGINPDFAKWFELCVEFVERGM